MSAFYVSIPVFVVTLLFLYGIGRTMALIWAGHRQKLAVLRAYETHPERFESSEEAITLFREQETTGRSGLRQDYVLTGVVLAVVGACTIFIGRGIGFGQLAVGLYIGGIACVVLGTLTALLGYLIAALTKPLLTTGEEDR